jgi:hypothetical protein
VDTRGYENPFASSEEEIGQMDVRIEEEDLIRESIRLIILEFSRIDRHDFRTVANPHPSDLLR